eukprot:TRINITY_DN5707_c0_g1_i1.p1 TRINITY_DN5707_c0_g1~~TRINITY_DN5707_c0_g1_i1.p1  ORF type:complete len:574 (+),score=216.66 TRINITY_DN5707_c0_g1_i1:45-1724(+)
MASARAAGPAGPLYHRSSAGSGGGRVCFQWGPSGAAAESWDESAVLREPAVTSEAELMRRVLEARAEVGRLRHAEKAAAAQTRTSEHAASLPPQFFAHTGRAMCVDRGYDNVGSYSWNPAARRRPQEAEEDVTVPLEVGAARAGTGWPTRERNLLRELGFLHAQLQELRSAHVRRTETVNPLLDAAADPLSSDLTAAGWHMYEPQTDREAAVPFRVAVILGEAASSWEGYCAASAAARPRFKDALERDLSELFSHSAKRICVRAIHAPAGADPAQRQGIAVAAGELAASRAEAGRVHRAAEAALHVPRPVLPLRRTSRALAAELRPASSSDAVCELLPYASFVAAPTTPQAAADLTQSPSRGAAVSVPFRLLLDLRADDWSESRFTRRFARHLFLLPEQIEVTDIDSTDAGVWVTARIAAARMAEAAAESVVRRCRQPYPGDQLPTCVARVLEAALGEAPLSPPASPGSSPPSSPASAGSTQRRRRRRVRRSESRRSSPKHSEASAATASVKVPSRTKQAALPPPVLRRGPDADAAQPQSRDRADAAQPQSRDSADAAP